MIPDLIIYLLKANLSIIIFYFCYLLFLKRFTFYSLNRIYLLVGLIYSTLYPLINLRDFFNSNPEIKQQINNISPDWRYSVSYVNSSTSLQDSNYWQIILLIFWTGVILLMGRLIIQLISLFVLHRESEPAASGSFNFRIVRKKVNPFSFWKTIYLNPEYHEPKELHSILEHEQIHVNQLHSLDVMIAEICTTFYWFNPAVWLIKDAIKANLEFITDSEVLKSGVDSKEYQYALLKINVLPQNKLPVNNFHFLTLKRRIAMMNKRQSKRIKQGVYILLLPAIMCLVLIVTNSRAALNSSQLNNIILHLPQTPSIAVKNAWQLNEEKNDSEKGSVQNKEQLVNSLESTAPGDTIKPKNVIIKLNAVGDSMKIGEKKPLYIVDGIKVNNLKRISPENIVSINVVKGAASTIHYGTPGSNGTIEIITKQGNSTLLTIPESPKGISLRPLQSEKVSLNNLSNELILLNGNEVEKTILNDLSVMSIGSIEVFKGEKALNKFGEKGRNGVISITTKPE